MIAIKNGCASTRTIVIGSRFDIGPTIDPDAASGCPWLLAATLMGGTPLSKVVQAKAVRAETPRRMPFGRCAFVNHNVHAASPERLCTLSRIPLGIRGIRG